MPYEHLAYYYDELMSGLDYGAYADYLLSFTEKKPSGLRVLDLACGTGRLAAALCGRGCDVVAADGSSEMLTVARQRDCGALFLLQDMAELDLYGTVEAVFCTLDALNYITSKRKLQKVFSRVKTFLEPDCVFVFDILTPRALKQRNGAVFTADSENAYCVWNCAWRSPLCRQDITLFTRDGTLWRRHDETHTERAYPLPEIGAMLAEAGFSNVQTYGFMSNDPPGEDAERVVFAARG